MKFRKCYLLAFATLGMFSCSNDKDDPTADSNLPKSINVSISGANLASTKAAPSVPGDIIGDQTSGVINGVDVYVTDASGVILRGERISSSDPEWVKLTGTGIKIVNVQSSASKVYVFGNLNATALTAEGTNITAVDLTKTLSQQQGTTNLLYLGMDETITPTVPEPTPPDATVGITFVAQVELTPIVSRFQITNIAFETSGSELVTRTIGLIPTTATVAWTGFNGDLAGVYLNRFYLTNANRMPTDLRENINSASSIVTGQWIFNTVDQSAIASYSNYAAPSYVALPLPQTATKCYAFNFFPENLGTQNSPKIHLQLQNLVKATLTSTNHDVFNPSLFPLSTATSYVNIDGFKNKNGIAMTGADFKANKLYNLSLSIRPYFLQDDIHHVQYNVLCTVTVMPWTVENLTPNFEGN